VSRHIFLVAAEDSGDALGADVIDAIRAAQPHTKLSGVGLQQMGARIKLADADLSGLAILGLFDGLKVLDRLRAAVSATVDAITAADPDVVVMIDSWGFMIRVAKALKARGHGALRVKLVGPQVWATRPGRAKSLAHNFDHLLCIHAFEQPFYAETGLPVTVVGNPAIGRMARGDPEAFRKAHGIAPDERLIGLLPGSRVSEIRRVAPVLEEACRQVCDGHPDRKVVCVLAESTAVAVRTRAAAWSFPHVLVSGEDVKSDAFAAMDVAAACSGTVTTELAEQGAPVVVGYKLGWITWAIARLFLMRSRFITLLNVAAGHEIAPEFVQTRFTAANVAEAVARLLENETARSEQLRAQEKALSDMAGPGRPTAEIAAAKILELAGARPT
jgi:lipid-A-disaccharide synthase